MSKTIAETLAEGGYYVSTTSGCSMKPMLRDRKDRVVICPTGAERLKKYDLPLYLRPDGSYVLHRIVAVRKDCYLIRGDNTYRKERVPDAWIVGVVSEFYRRGKRIPVTAKGYRFYAAFWNFIYPLRVILHFPRSLAGRVVKIFKKKDLSK